MSLGCGAVVRVLEVPRGGPGPGLSLPVIRVPPAAALSCNTCCMVRGCVPGKTGWAPLRGEGSG